MTHTSSDESATDELLTLREAAALLGLTTQRIYQMDEELRPVITPRGTKMKARHYRRNTVEQLISERGCLGGKLSPMAFSLHQRAAREAARQGVVFDISVEDFIDIGMSPCILCGALLKVPAVLTTEDGSTLHKIIRIVHDRELHRENAAAACAVCVDAMGVHDVRTYIAHCRTVVARHARLGAF